MRFVRRTSGPIAAGLWALSLLLRPSLALAQAPPADPEPPKHWTGTAGFGVSATTGNSDTVNYNLAFDVTRTPKARNVMKWTGLYIRGSQNDAVVVDRTMLGYRDEYTLSGRTFLFGQVDYLRDTFKRIDYLVAPTAGVGFKVIDTNRTKFSVDGGGGSISEKNPGMDMRTNGALTAGERLAWQVTPTATFKHATTALWNATDFSDGLYTVSVGMATRIAERLQLSIDLLDNFKNRPPTPQTRKNDVAFVTAITAKF